MVRRTQSHDVAKSYMYIYASYTPFLSWQSLITSSSGLTVIGSMPLPAFKIVIGITKSKAATGEAPGIVRLGCNWLTGRGAESTWHLEDCMHEKPLLSALTFKPYSDALSSYW